MSTLAAVVVTPDSPVAAALILAPVALACGWAIWQEFTR